MPLPTLPGVVRCTYSGLVPSGQKWANVMHFRFTGGASAPGASDIDALHALVIRLYSGTAFAGGGAWLTMCRSVVSLTNAAYLPLDGTSLTTNKTLALFGTGGGASMPSECAAVLTLRTAKRGRSFRGRVYLPVPDNTAVDTSGQMISTQTAKIVAQANGLIAALGGASVAPFWEWGVASYLRHSFEPLVRTDMDLNLDVQRHRRM